jgi:hypothetical protein
MPPVLIDTYLEREIFDKAELSHMQEVARLMTNANLNLKNQDDLKEIAKEQRRLHTAAMNNLDLIAAMILAVSWSGSKNQSTFAQARIHLQTVAVVLMKERLYIACNGLTWDDVVFRDEGEVPVGLVQQGKQKVTATERLRLVGPRKPERLPPQNPNAYYTHESARLYRIIEERGTTKPRAIVQSTKSAYDLHAYMADRDVCLVFRTKDRIREALRANGETRQLEFVPPPTGLEASTFHAEMQLVEEIGKAGERFEGKQFGVSKPCCQNCANQLDKLEIDYSAYSTFKEPGRWKAPTFS